MQTLVERVYEQKMGDIQIEEKYGTNLEEGLGCQEPERLFAMYSQGGWGGIKKYKSPFGGKTFVKPAIMDGGGKPPGHFRPAKKFGISGGGIARRTHGTPFIERYRPPHSHPPFGKHINGHVILPYGKKRRKIMNNTHL